MIKRVTKEDLEIGVVLRYTTNKTRETAEKAVQHIIERFSESWGSTAVWLKSRVGTRDYFESRILSDFVLEPGKAEIQHAKMLGVITQLNAINCVEDIHELLIELEI